MRDLEKENTDRLEGVEDLDTENTAEAVKEAENTTNSRSKNETSGQAEAVGEEDSKEAEEIRAERARRREEERARRRRQREKQVKIEKAVMVLILTIIVIGGTCGILLNLTSFRLSRKLSAGDKYTESGDYEMAQTSYQEALKIDPTTVEAYRCLAQNNLDQNDSVAAKEILYTGWEATQDEGLRRYYCTVVLNEAVEEINEKKCSLETVAKCIQVLKIESDNEDALSLLDTCYDRIFTGSEEENSCNFFMDEDVQKDTCSYEMYERELRDLLALYKEHQSDKIGALLTKYAVIDMEYVYLGVAHLEGYHKLLEDVGTALPNEILSDLTECLSQAIDREKEFADIFQEFEKGNYESAREFMISDTYRQIRDAFINQQSGYWEGISAVPINQEQMLLHRTEKGFRFSFLDYEECGNAQGVITIWGNKQLDDGVQRTSISYEPASENGAYYPHTEYVITYEYSNVLENGTDVRMNYRLVTKVTTEEGTVTNAICDWGGEYEWETSY